MASIFKKLSKFFSGGKGDDEDAPDTSSSDTKSAPRGNDAGFKTTVEVRREEPVIQSGGYAGGGIQGLNWYARALREDDEGFIAHQFFTEKPDFTAIPVARPIRWRAVQYSEGILEVQRAYD
mmetsp:Transcript_21591/g.26010  ORF Transcript_21591/g.26010 Transcript_21591/m.26010 type:complete len:122 (+) Transcript_21591:299-664(+)|eukprot:CAMPEP_0197847506 /NCGR_PEP_ID=MMETSP1438-20131217/6351_1 /TAXON_ID=1461541 /ORGANISM="Pterosperma sp., Strain CCMP1384" /LENGTH=121 /DNA_ID=CAMNT_0043459447 /DNA_START=287 /DNA_END=652 /DNA_ORIENTATION=+